jgi:tripartite-type tricarboxylate transporter receptor subunit TctC
MSIQGSSMIAMPSRFQICLFAAGIGIAAALSPAGATDYYAGKSIDFIIGGNPGGGFDIYARVVVRHLGRHIPGKPTIVAKNMPGAGGAKAGIHVSSIAAKDGLTIGAVTPGAITGPLLDDKPTLFVPNKVAWIGSANSSTRICAVYETSKVMRFADAMTQKFILAGGSHGDATHDYAHMMRKLTAPNAISVTGGYKGTLDQTLAMERGEADGMCGWDWSSAKSQKPEWIRDKKIRLVLQIGPRPNAELTEAGAPQFWTFLKGEENRQIAQLIVSQQDFQRPYFVAGGTPMDHVTVLRKAFDATMADPQFQADAEKMRVDISPLPGAEVQTLIEQFYAAPKPIVEKARQAVRP